MAKDRKGRKDGYVPRGERFKAELITATLTKANITKKHVILEFICGEKGLEIREELDLLDEHTVFRFSMFLESFQIKNLKHARKMLDVFIREKIEIELMINQHDEIIYSNSLKKKESDEFKKYNLLDKLRNKKQISKADYIEMRDFTYADVRSVMK